MYIPCSGDGLEIKDHQDRHSDTHMTQTKMNFSVNVVIIDNKTTKKCLRSARLIKRKKYMMTYYMLECVRSKYIILYRYIFSSYKKMYI